MLLLFLKSEEGNIERTVEKVEKKGWNIRLGV